MNSCTLKSVYIESIFSDQKDDYYGEDVKILGTATGFYYKYKDRMFLVTNKHVVTGKNTFTGQCISSFGSIPTALRAVVNFDVINNDDTHEYFEATLVDSISEKLVQCDDIKEKDLEKNNCLPEKRKIKCGTMEEFSRALCSNTKITLKRMKGNILD